jgi:hypothetical protein
MSAVYSLNFVKSRFFHQFVAFMGYVVLICAVGKSQVAFDVNQVAAARNSDSIGLMNQMIQAKKTISAMERKKSKPTFCSDLTRSPNIKS